MNDMNDNDDLSQLDQEQLTSFGASAFMSVTGPR